MKEKEKRLRAVLVGPAGVGKTTLVRVLNGQRLTPGLESESTVGLCALCVFTASGVPVEVWDTAGQERYAPMMDLYTRDADIIIAAHDHIHDTGHRQSKAILEKLQSLANPARSQTIASWQTKRDLCAAPNPTFTSAYVVHQIAHVTALEEPEQVVCLFDELVQLHLQRAPKKTITQQPHTTIVSLQGSMNSDTTILPKSLACGC